MSQLFASGGQSIGTSASASVLPMNIQDWFPLGLTGLISLQSKELFFSISWENELYCYRTKIPKTLVTYKNCNMYFTREPAMGPETACVVVSALPHGLVCLVVDAGSDLSCGLWLECLQVTYPYRCLAFSECGGTLRVRQSCAAPKWKSIISGILFSRIKSPRIIYTQELEGQVSRKYTDVLKPPSIGLN